MPRTFGGLLLAGGIAYLIWKAYQTQKAVALDRQLAQARSFPL